MFATEHVKKALNTLAFLAVQEIFMSETAKFANVVLPGASFFEKSGTFTNGERRVQRVNEVIPPLAGAEAAGGNVLRSLRPGDALQRVGARPLFHARESVWCRDGRSRRAPA